MNSSGNCKPPTRGCGKDICSILPALAGCNQFCPPLTGICIMLQRQPVDTGQGTVDNVLSLSPRWLLARHIYCTSRTAHKNSTAETDGKKGTHSLCGRFNCAANCATNSISKRMWRKDPYGGVTLCRLCMTFETFSICSYANFFNISQ